MPKFSIIIPVYNVAPYLRECLESVLAQTFTDWEAICVDDGSTDGSGEILDEYAGKDESQGEGGRGRFVVIHQKNAGVSHARNVALDLVRGEWTGFLDSDDSLSPTLFEELDARIEQKSNFDCVGYRMVRMDEATTSQRQLKNKPDVLSSCDSVLCSPLEPMCVFRRFALDKFYKTSCIQRLGLRFVEHLKVGEDILFAQLFLAQHDQILMAPSIAGYRYRRRSGSVMARQHAKPLTEPFTRFVQLYEVYKKIPRPGLRRFLAALAIEASYYGKGRMYLPGVRELCIQELLDSGVYIGQMMPFLLTCGTIKGRMFAFCFLRSPRWLRAKILRRMK